MVDVSIILPVRNEEKYIEETIYSLLQNLESFLSYELIVIDGMSTDNTYQIIENLILKNNNISLLRNPKKIVPCALNTGIKNSKGKYIVRVDSHSIFPENYIYNLINFMKKNIDISNVGCICKTIPSNFSRKCLAISLAASSIFGVGNSKMRTEKKKMSSSFVDTVPFGCYRRDIFEQIGLFDEELIRNQDDEFNARIIKNGGKIVLISSMELKIYARKDYSSLFKMFYQYGLFKPLVNIKTGRLTSLRQLFPVINLIMSLLTIFGSILFNNTILLLLMLPYCIFLSIGSLFISKKNKRFDIINHILFTLLIMHLSYGLGYLRGLLNFFSGAEKLKDLETNR
jgi:glycosyltransferase involved in cell wall biosynthesis